MDFNTHKKYAKLDEGVQETSNQGSIVTTPEVKQVDEAEKLAKIIADSLLNK